MLVRTVTFESFAAAATFASTVASSVLSARFPGTQICVMRTAPKPASASRSICAFAVASVVERTASSVAPRTSPPPPASAAPASVSQAASTATNRRGVRHMLLATVAMAMAVRLEDQLKQLPAKPGVYLFRDSKGDVLYVGKAKTLRS